MGAGNEDLKRLFPEIHKAFKRGRHSLVAEINATAIDIDRFVRETDQSSIQVFWRDWLGAAEGQPPEPKMARARREKLCPAPIGQFRDFLKSRRAWSWDYLERQCFPLESLHEA